MRRIWIRLVYVFGLIFNFFQLILVRGGLLRNLIGIRGKVYFSIHGKVLCGRNLRVNSGENFNIIGGDVRTSIIVGRNGKLLIGNDVALSNSTIICIEKVIIRSGAMLGGGVKIYDTDFHDTDSSRRLGEEDSAHFNSRPVTLGKRCFIGAHTIILKGVKIGNDSVIQAGSLVHCSVPPKQVWGGNPARFIKTLE